MLAIEEWGRGKFKPIVALAQVVAASAQECHELILKAREPGLLATVEAGGIRANAWLDLYRQPLNLEAVGLQFLCAPEQPREAVGVIVEWPLLRGKLNRVFEKGIREALTKGVSRELIDRGQRNLDRLYKWVHLPMMRRMLQGNDAPPAEFREWLDRPEFVFLMSVAMPCWLEYQQTPWELFQQARQGDFLALEKLIRLDSEVDKDNRLKAVIFRLRQQNRPQYELLQQARCEGRKKPITLAEVKYSLGGLLMKWSTEMQDMLQGEIFFRVLVERCPTQHHDKLRKWIKAQRKQAERKGIKCRLKAPDIVWLFNAVALDLGESLIDGDFKGQPNSIYKRLDRNAKRWPTLQETDISRAA
jgi:hypothetical protein